jgi:ankyrin repeat protein
VRGTVFDPNGAVIPNASVTLTNPQTEEQRRTTTAEDGQYTFTEVEPGDYHLKIEAPGFATAETRFIGVRAADDNRFDQTLTVAADTRLAGAVVVVMPSNPLVKAAADDDIDAVRAALASKVDPNVRDKDTQATALEYAVRNGNREILQVLLSAKAEVNTRDPQGQTPLMMVSEQVTSDLVWDLINAGAKVNLRDKEGDTALISAAEINNVDVLRTLLETGAKVNTANEEGQTALMIAAINGHVNNVRALLLAGANVNARDKDGNSALMHANANDEAAVARLLKAHGAVEFEVQQKQ